MVPSVGGGSGNRLTFVYMGGFVTLDVTCDTPQRATSIAKSGAEIEPMCRNYRDVAYRTEGAAPRLIGAVQRVLSQHLAVFDWLLETITLHYAGGAFLASSDRRKSWCISGADAEVCFTHYSHEIVEELGAEVGLGRQQQELDSEIDSRTDVPRHHGLPPASTTFALSTLPDCKVPDVPGTAWIREGNQDA